MLAPDGACALPTPVAVELLAFHEHTLLGVSRACAYGADVETSQAPPLNPPGSIWGPVLCKAAVPALAQQGGRSIEGGPLCQG